MADVVKPDLDDVEEAQERLLKQTYLESDDCDSDWFRNR